MSFSINITGLTICTAFFSLYSNCLLAQTETRINLNEKDSLQLKGTEWFNKFQFPSQPKFNTTLDYHSFLYDFEKRNQAYFLKPADRSNNFIFNQFKTENEFPGLGNSQWFNNQAMWDLGNNFRLGLETGLAIQNTTFDPFVPNYQLSFGFTIDYTINNRLSAYLFGRYITSPLNKPDDYFDPFMYNNSLFLQSGTGAGLKSNIKNKFIDFQIMSGYDPHMKMMNNFNSKLKIKF